MNYTVIKYLLLIIFTTDVFGQSPLVIQKELADNLFKAGNYFDAITEYKRLLFFDNENKYQFEGNFKTGLSYKKGDYLENAIRYFSLAEQNSNNTEEQFISRIEIIKCNILRGTTDQAMLLLNNLERDKRFSGKENDIAYWRGWVFMTNGDWQQASVEFGKISNEHPLRKICMQVVEESYSIGLAKTISYFIPGTGQIYSGEILSGLMSLGWNTLFAYVAIKSFDADRMLDGFIYTGLFFRFHRGNVENAEKFTRKNNSELSRKVLLRIYNEYSGEKP